jgi:exopolysaccharide biosynthesis polyprenyl glycosylphosphotransferase
MRLMTDTTTEAASLNTPHARRPAASAPLVSERVLVPVAAAITAGLLAREPFEAMVLTTLAFACAAFIVPERSAWANLLPLMRAPLVVLAPLLGILALSLVNAVTDLPGLSTGEMVLVAAVAASTSVVCYLSSRSTRRQGAVRTAIIGSIAEVPTLGALGGLAEVIESSGIDLLVLTSEAPRFRVFEEVSTTCLHLPVRLWELSSFYEEIFGHVPVAEINAAWFQYIMHPKFRAVAPASKRAVDIAVSLVAAIATAPLMLISALLIRMDGGPVFFKQQRIGEAGRQLTLYKLRTMKVADPDAQWAAPDDPRVTRVGRLLRKTHLDELPQLYNILRGEMSLVGPRPEQPEFVQQLEEVLPFYQRRHLLKPGLTGWAQVRCGYAGSDIGSAWKLSHDLYYLKHRSMAFDLAILGETFRTVFADRRFSIDTKWVPFIHGYDPLPPPPEALPGDLSDLADAASG